MKTTRSIKRKLGLFLYAGGVGTLLLAATAISSNKSVIRGRVTITEPGTYTVAQDIDLSADTSGLPVITIASGGVNLDLDGHTLTGADGIAVIDVLPGVAADRPIVIRDGVLRGGAVGSRVGGASARYENMLITEVVGHAIDATDSDLAVIRSRFRLSGASAIHVAGAPGYDWLIADTTINGTGGNAIDVRTPGTLTVERTVIRNSGACGLMAMNDGGGAATDVRIRDSRVIGAGRDGWHVVGKATVDIEGGLLRDITRNGVYVTGAPESTRVVDVIERDVGVVALKLHGGGSVEVVGNRIQGFGNTDPSHSIGIEIDGNGGPAVAIVRANTLMGGGDGFAGIRLQPGTTGKVLDNVVRGVEVGVATLARDTLIEGNQLRRIGTTGIGVFNDGAVIRGNSVWAGAGAEAWAGAGATAGILAGNGNHNILVEDNTIGGFATGLVQYDVTDWDFVFVRDNLFDGNGAHLAGGTDAGGNIFGNPPLTPPP